MSPICRKLVLFFRNAATTISLAALMIRHIAAFFPWPGKPVRGSGSARYRVFQKSVRCTARNPVLKICFNPVGISEWYCIGNFISAIQVVFHRTIGKLHHRVRDRLLMHHHLNLIGCKSEEPTGSDNFWKPLFIIYFSWIDGYFGTHIPVGMFESLCRSNCFELFQLFWHEMSSAWSWRIIFLSDCYRPQTLERWLNVRVHR